MRKTRKKIAVYNNKGGVGKSTVSTQLAHGLSKLGFKVLLINLDGQNDSITFLGLGRNDFKKTFYDLIDKRYPVKVDECIVNARENLDVIASSNLPIIESEFNMESRIDLIMGEKLKDLDNYDYDYILIDCGPQPGKVNTAILCYVDNIIMPVQLELAAVKAAGNVYGYLKDIRLNPEMVSLVIPNMYDKRTSHSKNCYETLKNIFDEDILTDPIFDRTSIKDAGAHGKTVFEFGDEEVAKQFFHVLERLVAKIG